jgi:hypothetical protein
MKARGNNLNRCDSSLFTLTKLSLLAHEEAGEGTSQDRHRIDGESPQRNRGSPREERWRKRNQRTKDDWSNRRASS